MNQEERCLKIQEMGPLWLKKGWIYFILQQSFAFFFLLSFLFISCRTEKNVLYYGHSWQEDIQILFIPFFLCLSLAVAIFYFVRFLYWVIQDILFCRASFWWLFLFCSLAAIGFSVFSFPYLAYLYAGRRTTEGFSGKERVPLEHSAWGWLSAVFSLILFFLLVNESITMSSSMPRVSIFNPLSYLYTLPTTSPGSSAQSIALIGAVPIDAIKVAYYKNLSLLLLSMVFSIPLLLWTLRDIKRKSMHPAWIFGVSILPPIIAPLYFIFAKFPQCRDTGSNSPSFLEVPNHSPKVIAWLNDPFWSLHSRKIGWAIIGCSIVFLIFELFLGGFTFLASSFNIIDYFISLISIGWILLDQFRKKRPSFGWLFWMCFIGAKVQPLFLFLYLLFYRSKREDLLSGPLSLKEDINPSGLSRTAR